jgi:methylenetetrahydrofolate dehydrogenase (NADP+) / methenyltetrahydrofolate cyclohydrolase / formyltetrahydrofolate synthetase
LFIIDHLTFRSIRDDVAERIKAMQATYPRFRPQLAIVQAGSRPDSSVYVRMKSKAAEEVGIGLRHLTLSVDSTAEEVAEVVKKLNEDEQISGILVQLPLGDHVGSEGERLVTESVSPEKDVDGCVTSDGTVLCSN